MNKLFAGLTGASFAALTIFGFAAPAQAGDGYDETPAPNEVSPTQVDEAQGSQASESNLLPNTGGPESALLIGGAAMLAVGGAAMVAARRRQTAE